jgi:hypothetical protein
LPKNAEQRSKNLGELKFQRQNPATKNQKHKKSIEGRKMFEERLLESLKISQNGNKLDDETIQIINKIQNHEKLTSQEFQKVWETIWKEGPKTVYNNQECWRKPGPTR